ncbi:hypothetical protein BDR26DRAFT_857688 [Obelidium mucronatum]|nr:hypothetical protein BDR26DRAFT_857688 [Obelidium mucronatum]
MPEPPTLLFFYGTLMHPHVLYSVIYNDYSNNNSKHPSSFPNLSAVVKNYTRYPLRGLPYPAMTRNKESNDQMSQDSGSVGGGEGGGGRSSGVHGIVTRLDKLAALTGLSPDKIVQRLDEFEGAQYRRVLVDVESALITTTVVTAANNDQNTDTWESYCGGSRSTNAKAWAYEWIDGDALLITDEGDWDYQGFVDTKLATYL